MKSPLLIAAVCSLFLVACGGGGSSSTTTASTSPADASASTATSLGAAVINSSSDSETFDLVASIGDTWRFVVNTTTGSFTVTPIDSQFGLVSETGTLVRTVNGNFVTYTLANRVSLVQDIRTKAVSGSMTVGGQTAAVTGTQFQLGNSLATLAGTYNFLGSSRNRTPSNSNYWPEVTGGQIKVSADGTGKICAGGKYVGNTCTAIDQGGSSQEADLRFTKVTGANGGFVKVELYSAQVSQWMNFGNLMIHPGDLGAAFVIDHFGVNDENVARVGNFFAVKAQTLSSGSADGVWKCDTPSGLATLTINGTSASIVSPNENPSSWTETLTFNKVNSNNNTLVDLPGFINTAGADNEGTVILPLSSSVAVIEHDSASRVGACYKNQ